MKTVAIPDDLLTELEKLKEKTQIPIRTQVLQAIVRYIIVEKEIQACLRRKEI